MASKEHQLGFGDYERSFVKKQTRRETFLAEMEKVVPFSELLSMIEPFYPRVGRQPRRKAAVSAGGDATHSLDAELELPE